MTFVVSAVVSLLLAGVVRLLSPWIDANAMVPLYIGCLTLPAFVVANTQDGIARSHDWMRLGLMPQFIVRQSLIIGFTAGAFVLGFHLGATAAMLASAAAVWIAMIGQMMVLNRRLGGHIEPGPKAYDFRGWLAISLPILLVEGFYLLLSYTDVLVLQQFRSSEEVGVYFAVVKTLALVSFIHYAMSATTAHRFAEYHALGDKARLSAYVAHAIKWTFWPSLAATILLLALGKPLLWLFGPQFVVGYDIMFIAAIGLVVRSRDRPGRAAAQHARPPAYLRAGLCAGLCHERGALRRAGAALRRPRRRGGDLDLADVRDRAAVLDRAAAARAARAGVRFRSADRSTKNAHIISAGDFSSLFGREATSQHRCDEMNPLRVVLEAPGSDLLVGANADMIHANDINHFLQAIDVFFEAGEKMPDTDRAARLGDHARVVAADLPCLERCRTHRRRPIYRGVGQEQGLGSDFGRLFHRVLGRVRDVADKPETVAGADHFGAE